MKSIQTLLLLLLSAIASSQLVPSSAPGLLDLLTPPPECTDDLDTAACTMWAADIQAHNLGSNLTALWYGNPPDWPTRLTGVALPPDLGLSMNASDFMPPADTGLFKCTGLMNTPSCVAGQTFCCTVVPFLWAFLGCCLVDCEKCKKWH